MGRQRVCARVRGDPADGGALGDRLGAKRVFIAGYAIFTLSSIGCGLAHAIGALIAWRLVQGIGAALLVPNSLAVLRLAFDDAAARNRAIGWWGAGGGIALAAGPLAGGLLIAAVGWRSIFLVNVPVGIAGIWMTWRFAPDTKAQGGRRLDLPAQLTGAFALAALTFASTEISALGWRSPVIVSAFTLCVALGIAFVRLEARNPDAMLPAGLWQDRIVRSSIVIGAIANLVFYGIVFTLSLLFQSVWHMTPVRAGVAFLPMMGVLMVMSIVAGRLTGRLGARTLATAGLSISAVGYLAMWPAIATQSNGLLAIPMLLAGGGIALTIPTITDAALAAVSGAQSGVASGLLNTARQVGGVMGVALFGFFVRETGAWRLSMGWSGVDRFGSAVGGGGGDGLVESGAGGERGIQPRGGATSVTHPINAAAMHAFHAASIGHRHVTPARFRGRGKTDRTPTTDSVSTVGVTALIRMSVENRPRPHARILPSRLRLAKPITGIRSSLAS